MRAAERFGVLAFGLAALLAALLWARAPLFGLLPAWLVAVTLVTFLAYWYDKNAAVSEWPRVPERVLLALTLAGGTLGAVAGMRAFRHKTSKNDFRLKLFLVVVLQAVLVAAYYWLLR